MSRYHAEIVFKDNEFYLQDIGSTTGTYIKIVDKIDLCVNMIIEVGSYQFQVVDIYIVEPSLADPNSDAQKSTITLEVYDGPEDFERSRSELEEGGTIGRKVNNKMSFSEDLHMSNLHCKISFAGNKFVLEDMASTNGYFLSFFKLLEPG